MQDIEYSSVPRIIALWSAPRSRSTAFLRMMMERDDLVAVHEPFSNRADLGRVRVGDLEVSTEPDLIAALWSMAQTTPVFFKDTTDFHFPAVLADRNFLVRAQHTFIIREPGEAIASHYSLNPQLGRDEVGFAWLYEIFEAVVDATGVAPLVMESDDLLQHPREVVQAYCERVDIPFVESAMSWERGAREEWARTDRWHAGANDSAAFEQRRQSYSVTVDTDPLLADYYRYHLPYYEKLHEHRLRP